MAGRCDKTGARCRPWEPPSGPRPPSLHSATVAAATGGPASITSRAWPMSRLIVTFPKGDTAFAAFVRSTIAALDAQARVDPGQVQAALRRWHTRAQVRPQHEL